MFASAIKQAIPSTSTLTADTNDSYSFPLHITATDLRPDLVWWDDLHMSLYMAELTVCFETNFEEAARRKTAKYDHLVEQAKARGYSTELLQFWDNIHGFEETWKKCQAALEHCCSHLRRTCTSNAPPTPSNYNLLMPPAHHYYPYVYFIPISCMYMYVSHLHLYLIIASFPGSPSFRAIIPRMTFDPPQRKAEGEPGRFCHMTRVMPRHRVYVSVLCVL